MAKYSVLFTAGNKSNTEDGNEDANDDDIIFTIKGTNLYVLVVTLSAKDNQKL